MAAMKFRKVSALPGTYEPNIMYMVSTGPDQFDIYVSDETGVSVKKVNGGSSAGGGGVIISVSEPDASVVPEDFWWKPDTSKLYIKYEIAGVPGWVNVIDSAPIEPLPLKSLLVYYGIPSAYKGLPTTTSIVSEISANCSYWVVGAGFQDPGDVNYANTVSIIQGVRDEGVNVYGNIPIGLGAGTPSYTVSQITAMVDQWKTIGVDGIYLDQYGFDFGTDRQRQVDIVNYIHNQDLSVCANCTLVQEYLCDTLAQTGWSSGDIEYTRWQLRNPSDTPSPARAGDSYMMDDFCYAEYGPSDMWSTQERASLAAQLAPAKQVDIWALSVFGETSPGIVDTSKLGNLATLSMVGEYISANAYMYDVTVLGSAGQSYGSSGIPVSSPLRLLPPGSLLPVQPAVNNYATQTAYRYFGPVYLYITNDPATQSTVAEGASLIIGQKDIIGTSPEQAPSNEMLGSAAYTDSTAYATSAQGVLAENAVQYDDLAEVATSGSYNDLSDKPDVLTVDNVAVVTNKQISGSNNTLTVDGTNKVGYLTIPPNSITTSYELALSDIGKSITKSLAGDMSLTIVADTVLTFPVGATVSIINSSASGSITIFSADTLVWSPEGTTGSRVLAPNGIATITKVPDSKWMIVGAGLT